MALDLQFIFGDEHKPSTCGQLPRFHGCERVEGSLSINADPNEAFDLVEITLEGAIRTWIKRKSYGSGLLSNAEAHQRPIHMTAVVPRDALEQIKPEPAEPARGRWVSNFMFDLLQRPFRIDSELDEACSYYATHLSLPPSLNVSSTYIRSPDSQDAGCEVLYTLHARCFGNGECKAEIRQDVHLLSKLQCMPPLETVDFPREYRLTSAKRIRPSFSARRTGHLLLSTTEPRPLQLCPSENTASTKLMLDFQLAHCSSASIVEAARFSHCTVTATLKSCTYISTCEQTSRPTLQQLSETSCTRMMSRSPKHVRKLHFPTWTEAPVEKQLQDTLRSSCANTWKSSVSLILNLEMEPDTLPSFTCPLIDRRYTLELSVRLNGRPDMTFKLDLPVQVVPQHKDCLTDDAKSDLPLYLEFDEPDMLRSYEGHMSDAAFTEAKILLDDILPSYAEN